MCPPTPTPTPAPSQEASRHTLLLVLQALARRLTGFTSPPPPVLLLWFCPETVSVAVVCSFPPPFLLFCLTLPRPQQPLSNQRHQQRQQPQQRGGGGGGDGVTAAPCLGSQGSTEAAGAAVEVDVSNLPPGTVSGLSSRDTSYSFPAPAQHPTREYAAPPPPPPLPPAACNVCARLRLCCGGAVSLGRVVDARTPCRVCSYFSL